MIGDLIAVTFWILFFGYIIREAHRAHVDSRPTRIDSATVRRQRARRNALARINGQ